MRVEPDQANSLMPVRVVVNNNTLTVFYNVQYETIYQSYDLKFIDINKDEAKPDWCFKVSDSRNENKYVVLCVHPQNIRADSSASEELKKWMDDVTDFKKNC